MKILYVDGGHPLQSADDCLMLAKLCREENIEWYSTGYYALNNKSGDLPKIEPWFGGKDFYESLSKYVLNKEECNLNIVKNEQYGGINPNILWNFSEDFIDRFDVIFLNHNVINYLNNAGAFGDKKVILKTFGMHPIEHEKIIGVLRACTNLYVIRNNPLEYLRTPFFGGYDAIIRGSVVKDEYEISGWKGNKKEVITLSNNLNHTEDIFSQNRLKYYKEIKQKIRYQCNLFGTPNYISHETKIEQLQSNRVNLVVGTPGSSNTYSLVEALVMGMPIVVFGQEMWQSDIYEVNLLIKNGVNGFIVESPDEAVEKIELLMNDYELCKYLGANARLTGINIYGRDNLYKKWKRLLLEDIWKNRNEREKLV